MSDRLEQDSGFYKEVRISFWLWRAGVWFSLKEWLKRKRYPKRYSKNDRIGPPMAIVNKSDSSE